jgi:phosphonate transport system substrate-binding protein
VRDDIPADLARQVHAILVDLIDAPGGAAILAGMETARFFPADNDTYAIVRDFVARFESEVRPVETP